MKLNFGAGEFKLKDCINVDVCNTTNPDIISDLRLSDFPFKEASFETIHAMHVMEHIEVTYWAHIFEEFHRVLESQGELLMAYPEFEICALNYIENKRGAREYWRKTLYGRQLYPGDYHITPMRTQEVIKYLTLAGFYDFKYGTEVNEDWNTFLMCKKGKRFTTKEDLLRREIFHN